MLSRWFLSLPDREKYDVMSAVRGPDVSHPHLETLKDVITARLRSLVYTKTFALRLLNEWGARVVHEPATEKSFVRVRSAVDEIIGERGRIPGVSHFVMHLRQAMHATTRAKIPFTDPIWGDHYNEILHQLERIY